MPRPPAPRRASVCIALERPAWTPGRGRPLDRGPRSSRPPSRRWPRPRATGVSRHRTAVRSKPSPCNRSTAICCGSSIRREPLPLPDAVDRGRSRAVRREQATAQLMQRHGVDFVVAKNAGGDGGGGEARRRARVGPAGRDGRAPGRSRREPSARDVAAVLRWLAHAVIRRPRRVDEGARRGGVCECADEDDRRACRPFPASPRRA